MTEPHGPCPFYSEQRRLVQDRAIGALSRAPAVNRVAKCAHPAFSAVPRARTLAGWPNCRGHIEHCVLPEDQRPPLP
jgi:hypothetical protein